MSRKIICRFRDEQALINFCTRNNINITRHCKTYYWNTKTAVDKRQNRVSKPVNEEWKKYWKEMPACNEQKVEAYACVHFEFGDDIDCNTLSDIFGCKITDRTKSVWVPELEKHTKRYLRVVCDKQPRYPIYVVSKSRADLSKAKTVYYLNKFGTHHYVVVEPQQFEEYKRAFANLPYTHVLELDMKYKEEYETLDDLGDTKSMGPGPARNFCMDRAKADGYEWVHILDDNIDGWHYLDNNIKYKMRSAVGIAVLEDFVDRFANVGEAGLNYSKFCKENDKVPAYVTNTRIYSNAMCNVNLPYRWRGRYNEDTILSLDLLSNGYCTIQLNAYLADKMTTQRIKGGNTEAFYASEGTADKSKMLAEVYPQYAKVVHKFRRIHHQVDYSSFVQKLEYKNGDIYEDKENNYGMIIVRIPEEWDGTDKDCNAYILNHLNECEIIRQ